MAIENSATPFISPVRQAFVWLVSLAVAAIGALDLVAEWDPNLALLQFILLLVAPIAWMIRPKAIRPVRVWQPSLLRSWTLALMCGGVSLGMHASVGTPQQHLPPAYHDEYSYLFQAQALLAGQWSFPSPPVQPELFDQMHVLNEGRMASRYLPGNGLWLAPFVALGHPVGGIWLAGVLSTIFVFWIGRELGGEGTGFLAGLLCGVSPGIAVFGNLLLAHQATLLGLSLFLWGMVRLQARRQPLDALWAGLGLAFAMLCRPATAAGVGFPFGVWAILFLLFPRLMTGEAATIRRRTGVLLGLGLPLLIGFGVIFSYNQAITGSGWKSTYQVYTDIYTPRHVYGFNNVVRGEQHLGPKVIDSYDRWTENLTPELATQNAFVRILASWQWTLDILPLAMTTAACLVVPLGRWKWILAAIVSLHAIHVPYWYAGILGWHYVYESCTLWLLLLAGLTSRFAADWRTRHYPAALVVGDAAGRELVGSLLGTAGPGPPAPGTRALHDSLPQAETRRLPPLGGVDRHRPAGPGSGGPRSRGHASRLCRQPGRTDGRSPFRTLPPRTDEPRIGRPRLPRPSRLPLPPRRLAIRAAFAISDAESSDESPEPVRNAVFAAALSPAIHDQRKALDLRPTSAAGEAGSYSETVASTAEAGSRPSSRAALATRASSSA